MSQKLRALAERFPKKAAEAVQAELAIEMEESKRRTPVLTGLLKGSHQLQPTTFMGNKVKGTIIVTAPYALPVHERLDVFHRNGQAKFLESTLFESRVHMGARIARRLNLATIHF